MYIWLFLFPLSITLCYGDPVNIQSFNSSGIYFKHLGTLKIQIGTHYVWSPIDVTVFEEALVKYRKDALHFYGKCAKVGLDCSEDHGKAENNLKELVERLDAIYNLLGERRQSKYLQRKKRWCMFCRTKDHSGEIGDIRRMINSNFQNVQFALENQRKMVDNLNNQNMEIKNSLQAHQSQINEAATKINELVLVTKDLASNVEKNELKIIFNNMNSELFQILTNARELQKIVEEISLKNYISPQVLKADDLLDIMMKYPYKENFMYEPILPNYPKILKLLKTFAYLLSDKENVINIIVALPLFSLEKVDLYEPLTLPIISNKKVVLIENNHKYCAISENMEKYNCGSNLDSTIMNNGEFYLTDEVQFPLFNSLKGDKCLINIFREVSIDNCKFKYLDENIEIFHNLVGSRYLYAIREKTKYFFECGAELSLNRNDVINGTGFLELKEGCKFSTDHQDSILQAKHPNTSTPASQDKFEFDLDTLISEKVNNLTLPTDFTAKSDKEILPSLSALNERGVYFVPEMHWFVKFLHSKVFHSIVTILVTLLIIGGLVYCFVYYPRYAKMRDNVMKRIQSFRVRRRVISAQSEEEDKLNVKEIVAFYESKGIEKPVEIIHVKKTNKRAKKGKNGAKK